MGGHYGPRARLQTPFHFGPLNPQVPQPVTTEVEAVAGCKVPDALKNDESGTSMKNWKRQYTTRGLGCLSFT